MNTLLEAQAELVAAESAHAKGEEQDGNGYWRSRSERHYQQAAVYAAVAQAEQLKRIADNMDRWLSIQGVEAEFFEAQDRWKNEQIDAAAGEFEQQAHEAMRASILADFDE